MYINRSVEQLILNKLQANKVILLFGARRVGKTELLKKIINQSSEKILFLVGDDISTHQILENRTVENYKRLLGDYRFLIIDEAQEISEIGLKLKLMIDNIHGLKVLVTGSSAFELNNQIGEPLVGRMFYFNMFPISQLELSETEDYLISVNKLPERLIYGSYPELINIQSFEEKRDYLLSMLNSYLLKDVLAYEGIQKRDVVMKLLQKIAFRCGSEISLESLGAELQISKNTVDRYLDLFKKTFILYDVGGFSKNRDNEITKKKKWFFVDNGIRNAVVNDFRDINSRNDLGLLWENYLNSERNKLIEYKNRSVNSYFWRTHTKQEIDRIELENNLISAFEYKWSKSEIKIPSQFASAYSDAKYQVINKDNYLDFIIK